jgi:PAS domain-containing protein
LALILGIFLGRIWAFGYPLGFSIKIFMTMDHGDDVEDEVFSFGSPEEQYHKMVEEVEDYAILMLNRKGIIQNWNKGAEKIKGYTEAEIVGKHFRIFYTREDREAGLPEKLVD